MKLKLEIESTQIILYLHNLFLLKKSLQKLLDAEFCFSHLPTKYSLYFLVLSSSEIGVD